MLSRLPSVPRCALILLILPTLAVAADAPPPKPRIGLFATFLKHRAGSAWEGQTGKLRSWIMQPAKAVAAVA